MQSDRSMFKDRLSNNPIEEIRLRAIESSLPSGYRLVKTDDEENNKELEYTRVTRTIIREACYKYDSILTFLRALGIIGLVIILINWVCTHELDTFYLVIDLIGTGMALIAPSSELLKNLLIFKFKCKNYYNLRGYPDE